MFSYPSDLQENVGTVILRATVRRLSVLLEISKYCCPVEFLNSGFLVFLYRELTAVSKFFDQVCLRYDARTHLAALPTMIVKLV